MLQFTSVQSLSHVRFFATHGLQQVRPPCPSPVPAIYSNSCPLSRWCHPTISSSIIPFYPAHHLLAVPVASLLSDPSAGLRWTHPRLSSVCATVICSGLPPSSALPGLKAPPGGDSSLTRGGRGPRLWRQLLAGPWKYVRRFLRAIMLHPSYFTTINPASNSWVDSQLYKFGVCI